MGYTCSLLHFDCTKPAMNILQVGLTYNRKSIHYVSFISLLLYDRNRCSCSCESVSTSRHFVYSNVYSVISLSDWLRGRVWLDYSPVSMNMMTILDNIMSENSVALCINLKNVLIIILPWAFQ
jgi:hypothetical protein